MPTYDYECSGCGHRWELFQSIKAKPQKKCPSCGRPTAKRKLHSESSQPKVHLPGAVAGSVKPFCFVDMA